MLSPKQLKVADRAVARQQQVVGEFQGLLRDIQRCEKTVIELRTEFEAIQTRYPAERTTRDDVGYLGDLLKCTQKKLAWEKTIGSLQKRLPALLEELSGLMHDPDNPPATDVKAQMLGVLQEIQASMERLQNTKA